LGAAASRIPSRRTTIALRKPAFKYLRQTVASIHLMRTHRLPGDRPSRFSYQFISGCTLVSIRVRCCLLVLGYRYCCRQSSWDWRYTVDRGRDIDIAINGLATRPHHCSEPRRQDPGHRPASLRSGTGSRSRRGDTEQGVFRFPSPSSCQEPAIYRILTIDPDGALICDSLRTGRALDLRDRDYFKRGLDASRHPSPSSRHSAASPVRLCCKSPIRAH
jgi:hypothetical protein